MTSNAFTADKALTFPDCVPIALVDSLTYAKNIIEMYSRHWNGQESSGNHPHRVHVSINKALEKYHEYPSNESIAELADAANESETLIKYLTGFINLSAFEDLDFVQSLSKINVLRNALELYDAHVRIQKLEGRLDSVFETLHVVGKYLGIDPEQARKLPGKPSDVYIAAIETKVNALRFEDPTP